MNAVYQLGGIPRAVAIELPFNVRNNETALSAVGGKKAIAQVTANPEESLELRLRTDPFHHPVSSKRADCNNLVLEIELPRWALDQAEGNVQKALELAGTGNYSYRPIYFADTNIRFREMADFQYYTGNSPFVSKVKDTIFTGNLDDVAKFRLNESATLDPAKPDVLPPPRFSQQTQPFFYGYKQNPFVALVNDGTGSPRLVNKSTHAKIVSIILTWGEPAPAGPPPELDQSPRPVVERCIGELTKLFKQRQSYTRRALEALVSPEFVRYLKYALPYVAYFYRSGPWRGSYIKYGADPCNDKLFAIYQVEHFRIFMDASSDDHSRPIYTFDGKTFPTSRMLQLCDVEDPFLLEYINTESLRDTVDSKDGWYLPETMAIIRKVLRAKLLNAKEGNPPLDLSTLTNLVNEAVNGINRMQDEDVSGDELIEEEGEDFNEADAVDAMDTTGA